MSNVVAINQNTNSLLKFSDDQKNIIKDLVKKSLMRGVDVTDTEFGLFIATAERMGLDPMARQIYMVKYKNHKTGYETCTFITGIDGYRAIAARTGAYAGQDEPQFELDKDKLPTSSTVTVYRLVSGVRCPFTAKAYWNEYVPDAPKDKMWHKMPFTMLAKVAEALALRKAFPSELSGAYTQEEMQQAGIVDAESVTVKHSDTLNKKIKEIDEIEEVDSSNQPLAKTKPMEKVVEQDRKATIEKIAEAYGTLGMSIEDLEAELGTKQDAWTWEDIYLLRKMYKEKKNPPLKDPGEYVCKWGVGTLGRKIKEVPDEVLSLNIGKVHHHVETLNEPPLPEAVEFLNYAEKYLANKKAAENIPL